MSLEGKVAFVSGASRPKGIGRAIALTLARKGADVAVSGRTHMEGAMAVADEIRLLGRKAAAVQMDASDYDSVTTSFVVSDDASHNAGVVACVKIPTRLWEPLEK